MKKRKIIYIVTFSILMLFAVFTNAYANNLPEPKIGQKNPLTLLRQIVEESSKATAYSTFKLPSSLTTIEDSAFEGTSITTVELPDSLESIGDQAFAYIESLRTINIPDNTKYIGKGVFKGSHQITITGTPKGYARTWAKENGIPFIPVTSFYAFNTPVQITALSLNRPEQQKSIIYGETTKKITSKPNGRMAGELNAERYEKLTAYHIQGRAPPMG